MRGRMCTVPIYDNRSKSTSVVNRKLHINQSVPFSQLPVASCHLQLVTNIHLRASVVYSLEIEVFKFKVNFYDSGSLNPSSQYILVGRAVVWLPQPVQAVEEAV